MSPLRRYWRWWVVGILVVLVAAAVVIGPPEDDIGQDAGRTGDDTPTVTAGPGDTTATSTPTDSPDTPGVDPAPGVGPDNPVPPTSAVPDDLYPCSPADSLDVLAISGTLTNGAAALGSAFTFTDGVYRWVVADLLDATGATVATDGGWVLSAGQVGTISESAARHSMVPEAIDVFVDLPIDAREVAASLTDCTPR